MKKHIISVLVENKPGVLNRVTSLFRRRNFNIDSLTVGRTQHPEISRMTILMEATAEQAHKVEQNLYKLLNVVQVEHLSDQPKVVRDLALIKVAVNSKNRAEVMQIADIFRARLIDVSAESVIIEITGEEDKLERFLDLLMPLGIVEMVRTGIVALGRGDRTLAADRYRSRGSAKVHKGVI